MEDLKYGQVRGGNIGVTVPLAASQAFKARSGRFVYLDGSGHAVLCGDGANELFGHAEESERTSSASAAAESAKVVIDPTAVFRIPVLNGTFAITMVGKTCDLIDVGGYQGADLAAADDDVLIVVDGDVVGNKWVDVMINQKERAQSGVV